MGEKTGIAWCDHTFNPWIGCKKVSPGCVNCYAERENKRFGWLDTEWGDGYRRTSASNWKKPLEWGKQAESCNQYLSKGSKVLVEGRLKAEPTVYQRKDGTWASSYELTAETVRFLTTKGEQVESTDLDVPF